MSKPIAGKISSLEVSTDGTQWVKVRGRTDMTLNLTKGAIDASHMDEEGWSNYLDGRREWSIDGTLRYIEDDPGQTIIVDNYFADAEEIHVRFRMAQGVGKKEWTGKAVATDVSVTAADEAPSDMTLALQGNGPLTPAEQTE